jgi:hypothetical protein
MSYLDKINWILKGLISFYVILIAGEIFLIYDDIIKVRSSIVFGQILFGLILTYGTLTLYLICAARKLLEFLVLETIEKRPFRELHTNKQVELWNDISSSFISKRKKYTLFRYLPLPTIYNLELSFERSMAYIDKKLNTKYKDKTEDEISGADAVLVAAKKVYDKDTNDYYNENIFNKNDNWKNYGTTLPLDTITEVTKFEEHEKWVARTRTGLKIILSVLYFASLWFAIQ